MQVPRVNSRNDNHPIMHSPSYSVCALLAVLLAMWVPVYPQARISLGVAAGINVADQSFSELAYEGYSSSSRLGYFIGGLAEISISDQLFIQAEPTYIEKGLKNLVVLDNTQPDYYNGPAVYDVRLSYLELPLLLKIKIGHSDFKPFVFVGPNIGFLLSATYGRAGQYIQGLALPFDVKDRFTTVDLAVDFGGGLEYRLSETIGLIGSARYSAGLNNISRSSINGIKSHSFQFAIGSLFSL